MMVRRRRLSYCKTRVENDLLALVDEAHDIGAARQGGVSQCGSSDTILGIH